MNYYKYHKYKLKLNINNLKNYLKWKKIQI